MKKKIFKNLFHCRPKPSLEIFLHNNTLLYVDYYDTQKFRLSWGNSEIIF